MESKKCKCGAGEKIFCRKCSKIQMSILLKNGNDHLKYENYRGHKSNPVWYSHLKYNYQTEKEIIEGMLRRFYNSTLVPATNQVNFYSNDSNKELFVHKV